MRSNSQWSSGFACDLTAQHDVRIMIAAVYSTGPGRLGICQCSQCPGGKVSRFYCEPNVRKSFESCDGFGRVQQRRFSWWENSELHKAPKHTGSRSKQKQENTSRLEQKVHALCMHCLAPVVYRLCQRQSRVFLFEKKTTDQHREKILMRKKLVFVVVRFAHDMSTQILS